MTASMFQGDVVWYTCATHQLKKNIDSLEPTVVYVPRIIAHSGELSHRCIHVAPDNRRDAMLFVTEA